MTPRTYLTFWMLVGLLHFASQAAIIYLLWRK